MSRSVHPLPVGTHVHHVGQLWARRLPGGTAIVREVAGPYRDGAYEYVLDACEEFAQRPGPDNPMTARRQWASYATLTTED
ncbi:hypothetical protein SUDANB1_05642 [Streptomyces sp. enrichment culture]|uniref:hypothetical protein n=1 Tax=Streptomyces sp. enrichment culture TaxID=1795815 RepID=UPI003F56A428